MSNLIPRPSEGLLERFSSSHSSIRRAVNRDLQLVAGNLGIAQAQDVGLAQFTYNQMEHTAALDRRRQELAGNDGFLDRLLAEEELSYVTGSQDIKQNMFTPRTRGLM